jgi:hypothetical protein
LADPEGRLFSGKSAKGIARLGFRLNQNDKGMVSDDGVDSSLFTGPLNWVLHNGHELLVRVHCVKHSL